MQAVHLAPKDPPAAGKEAVQVGHETAEMT